MMRNLGLSFFGTGHIRPAPGTWGSLAALPLAWLIMVTAGPWAFLAAIIGVTWLGTYLIHLETKGGDQDPSWIVIDEVAGQWIAVLPIAFGAARAGVSPDALWPGWIAAFMLFRLFDIWKPGPVGWADRRHDAIGVMLDDVIAGIFAALGVIGLAALAHAGIAEGATFPQ